MSKPRHLSRRGAVKLVAATAALPLVHIRTVGAAGKLGIGVVDHWVPKSNEMLKQQIETWAAQNKVVVLLFVNQTTTSTRLDGPRVDLNRVRLTLVKVDGRWLVNKVVAL